MATTKKRVDFLNSEEGVTLKRNLRAMVLDDTYNTDASYSANSELYPNNMIPFADKHMNYICSHPDVDPQQYISNLRLMTKVK